MSFDLLALVEKDLIGPCRFRSAAEKETLALAENLRSDLTEKRKRIVEQVKAQIVGYLRGGSFNSRRLADIVNYIRLNEGEFEEWHESKTAELFAPPKFRNRKEAGGYFF